MSLIVILFSNVEVWSGIRESNPPPRLGKPVHYRCANPAFFYIDKIFSKFFLEKIRDDIMKV